MTAWNRRKYALICAALFARTQFYDMLQKNGWLIHKPDGTPRSGSAKEIVGRISIQRSRGVEVVVGEDSRPYVNPYGFDYLWLDETEPDSTRPEICIRSVRAYAFITCIRCFTRPPYTKASGGISRRQEVMILARAAYLRRSAMAQCSRRATLFRRRTC